MKRKRTNSTCGGLYHEPLNEHLFNYYNQISNCPYCNNRRFLPGFNTLKMLTPEWMKEWSYQNNYLTCDPDEIMSSYAEDVWWKCGKCGYDYQMSPKNRSVYEMRHKITCPKCKGLRRKVKYFF